MATFVLIHGGGDPGTAWAMVAAELRGLGHDVVTVDLPCEDESAGLWEYAGTDRSGPASSRTGDPTPFHVSHEPRDGGRRQLRGAGEGKRGAQRNLGDCWIVRSARGTERRRQQHAVAIPIQRPPLIEQVSEHP